MPRIKNSQQRLELIDRIISENSNGVSRQALFERINYGKVEYEKVSLQSIDKDIAELKGSLIMRNPDIDVELKHKRDVGYSYSVPGFRYFKYSIDDNDKNMLMLASSLFNVFKGTPLQGQFGELVNKVLKNSHNLGRVKGLEEIDFLQVESVNASSGNEWIPRLLEAIYEKETLEMSYKGVGKPKKKKIISPYILKQYRNRWYMVAYDHTCDREEKTNVFLLDSIQNLEISNKPYTTDRNFIRYYFQLPSLQFSIQ